MTSLTIQKPSNIKTESNGMEIIKVLTMAMQTTVSIFTFSTVSTAIPVQQFNENQLPAIRILNAESAENSTDSNREEIAKFKSNSIRIINQYNNPVSSTMLIKESASLYAIHPVLTHPKKKAAYDIVIPKGGVTMLFELIERIQNRIERTTIVLSTIAIFTFLLLHFWAAVSFGVTFIGIYMAISTIGLFYLIRRTRRRANG